MQRVLELFAQSLEEEVDFIYNGIASKINRRAVKKYFDNSVAKARNMLKWMFWPDLRLFWVYFVYLYP